MHAFATRMMSRLDRDDTTYRFNPTGGVSTPMDRFTTMIIPNASGSICKLSAMGSRTGDRIIMADPASRNIPAMTRRTFTIIRNTAGESVMEYTKSAIICGIFITVTAQDSKLAVAITTNTMAADFALCTNVSFSSRRGRVRYTTQLRNSA